MKSQGQNKNKRIERKIIYKHSQVGFSTMEFLVGMGINTKTKIGAVKSKRV